MLLFSFGFCLLCVNVSVNKIFACCVSNSIFPISLMAFMAWFWLAQRFLGAHMWYNHRTDCTASPWVHKAKSSCPGGGEKRSSNASPETNIENHSHVEEHEYLFSFLHFFNSPSYKTNNKQTKRLRMACENASQNTASQNTEYEKQFLKIRQREIKGGKLGKSWCSVSLQKTCLKFHTKIY